MPLRSLAKQFRNPGGVASRETARDSTVGSRWQSYRAHLPQLLIRPRVSDFPYPQRPQELNNLVETVESSASTSLGPHPS
jgi:hypothetical protein